ncbi:hypothetical protein JCM13304A_10220 [Desulfothermus okinawensis JCM 13304]
MERKKKLIAAISAAIYMYLEQEAMAASMMAQTPVSAPRQQINFPVTSPWSLAGRMSIMERRFNWQYRLCKF